MQAFALLLYHSNRFSSRIDEESNVETLHCTVMSVYWCSFEKTLKTFSEKFPLILFRVTPYRWLRFCRLLAKKKWRGIGAMGVVTILLAALLLCLTAYFEKWGQSLNPNSALDSSAPAPTTEDPPYFEDKVIPEIFKRYATLHNSATNEPQDAKYVLYEIPGNSTVAQSVLGLVSVGVKKKTGERNTRHPTAAAEISSSSRNLASSLCVVAVTEQQPCILLQYIVVSCRPLNL